MPEYLSPGVYVEEVDAGPKPIAGVSTSTAGMVGVTAFGPTSGKPRLVTSFPDFARTFGGFLAPPAADIAGQWSDDPAEGGRWWWFPLSVKGFFDNGGQRLYVKRVFSADATASIGAFGKGLVADVVADAKAGQPRVQLEHVFGIAEGGTLKLFDGQTGVQLGPDHTVSAYDSATGRVTLAPALAAPVLATRGDFAEVHPRTAVPVLAQSTTLAFAASSRGAWGNNLYVRTRPVTELALNLMHSLTAGGAEAKSKVVATTAPATVEVDDVTGLSDGDHVTIAGGEYAISNLDGPTKKFDVTPQIPAGQNWTPGTTVMRLRPANVAGGDTIAVFGAAQLYPGALLELDNGHDKETATVDSVTGDLVTLSAPLTKLYHEGHRVRSIGIAVTVQYRPGGVIEAEESFGPLRLHDDGTTNHVVTHVNARSAFVKVKAGAAYSESDLASFPTATDGQWTRHASGDDKLATLSVDDFVGTTLPDGTRSGIQALEDIDEISICTVPNVWSQTVRSALIMHCEQLKDRFAIVDPQNGLTNEGVRAAREPIDTKYAALYHPWTVVRDPLSKRNVQVAPSGHMAGIYARTDVERGVHKAPANAVVRGIVELAQDVTKREQDLLNPKGINVIRHFPGSGIRVWGARTLTSDQSWKYVNVRRLFLFVEESIDEGTQWVVFEPNEEPLWARVRQSVTNFLTTVWRDGALEGATPAEAFFVTCDRTVMTQDDIDNGRLICVIGIAPVKPAEFVIFRIQQFTRALLP